MNLINLLPEDYKKSYAIVQLQNAIQGEGNALEQLVEELGKQLYIDTATWGIERWERLYGIATNKNKNISFRRTLVKAKMRGTGTTTISLIKNVAESFVNGDVDVVEHNDEYRLEIIMISVIGIPPNMDDLKLAIEEIKPAHIAVDYTFRYRTHDEIRASGATHNQLATVTHEQIRQEKVDFLPPIGR